MALTYPVTATTGRSATATTFTANLPTPMTNGDLLVVAYLANDNSKYLLTPTGWGGEYHTAEGQVLGTIGFIYREVDGTEGLTQVFDVSTTSDRHACVAFTIAGRDSADQFNSNNYDGDYHASDTTVWDVASGVITGINNSDSNVILIGGAKAVRSISTQDSGLTLIDSVNDGYSVHVLYEDTPGSGSSAYSNTMSGARAWLGLVLEIKAASAGGVSITPRRSFQHILTR